MKSLEDYRKEVSKRIFIFGLISFAALTAVLFGDLYLKRQFVNKGFINNYVVGFFVGIEVTCIFIMKKFSRARSDETVLKKMYVEETDEREVWIKMKSGGAVIPYLSSFMMVIALPAAYISLEIFITLTVVAFGQLLISHLLRNYWSKKI